MLTAKVSLAFPPLVGLYGGPTGVVDVRHQLEPAPQAQPAAAPQAARGAEGGAPAEAKRDPVFDTMASLLAAISKTGLDMLAKPPVKIEFDGVDLTE